MVEAVRTPIRASWQRCLDRGLTPDRLELPYTDELDLTGDFARAARPPLDRLEAALSGTRVNVALTDDAGVILDRRAAQPSFLRALEKVGFAPGFSYHERDAGTNGMGTALEERRPVRVVGREHFCDLLTHLTCVGIPVRHPVSGRIQGVLDLTSEAADAHPLMTGLAHEAALAIEQRLLDQCSDRERALLHAFLRADRRFRTPALLLDGDGTLQRLGVPAVITGRDEVLLTDAAAGLISAGRRAALEVPLSYGRTAMLLCRPVGTTYGESGAVVEVSLPYEAGPHSIAIGTATPREAGGSTGSSGDDAGQLLVGEPGVSKLAVAARRRLELLCDVGALIGTTLDVTRTAEELAEAAVPRFADRATVDLFEPVLRGEQPGVAGLGLLHAAPPTSAGGTVRFHPAVPQARALALGAPVLADGDRLIAVPLRARQTLLGVACFERDVSAGEFGPFEEDDLALAQELAARTALAIDNARLFTREHHLALELQRSLLPQTLPEQHAVEAAYRYQPARGQVGGDWFDVIPLSGARVALVVGDVAGHGLHAAAAMGRLRTAIHTFSALDLPPDELLSRLDDLADRLDGGSRLVGSLVSATCLYAVYDPVSRRCVMARAGHPPPALVLPDGRVEIPDLPAGPPLGAGGLSFETAEFELPEGSDLVLFTDGLIGGADGRDLDPDTGMQVLRHVLSGAGRTPPRTARTADEVCAAVEEALLPSPYTASDDVALLVARTRTLDSRRVASWDVPDDPAAVSDLRAAIIRRLTDWGLEDLAFTTELIASELITNAIRHADGPVQARLLRDRALVFEVSDGSGTSPRLRRAATTDEGGRGIFLVAQLSARWGTRHTPRGKVIWTEQPIPGPGEFSPSGV
ncbi:SpoIIE family protein phosphatase [Streptomyces sp. NPDC059373]